MRRELWRTTYTLTRDGAVVRPWDSQFPTLTSKLMDVAWHYQGKGVSDITTSPRGCNISSGFQAIRRDGARRPRRSVEEAESVKAIMRYDHYILSLCIVIHRTRKINFIMRNDI
jgi:hypothetical protein